MESFDWLTASSVTTGSSHLLRKWDESSEVGNNSIINTSFGRFSTSGLQHGNASNSIGKYLGANYSTLIVGFAFCWNSSNQGVILAFQDASSAAGNNQINLRTNGSRVLEVYRNSTLLGTASMASPAVGSYHYIEIKVVFHGSTGAVTLKLDGSTVLTLTGQNTISTANAYANRIYLGNGNVGGGTAAGHFYDDVYVCDTVDQSTLQTGSPANNDFLGDVRVQNLTPSGDGNYSQWVGSDGNSTNNSLLVDETPSNDDTDYVASGTTGDRDTYAFSNLTPTSGTVYGVQIFAEARKDDAGTRTLYLTARSGSTDQDSAAATALSASYTGVVDIRGAAPGATGWTVTNVNSAEFGIKVG